MRDPTLTGKRFGTLTVGTATVLLEMVDHQPNGRGYYLADDVPAVVFGRDPDPQTLANGIAAMVMLLGLRPHSAGGPGVMP